MNLHFNCPVCNFFFKSFHFCSEVAINYRTKEKFLVIGPNMYDYIKVHCEPEEVQDKINSYISNLLFK